MSIDAPIPEGINNELLREAMDLSKELFGALNDVDTLATTKINELLGCAPTEEHKERLEAQESCWIGEMIDTQKKTLSLVRTIRERVLRI